MNTVEIYVAITKTRNTHTRVLISNMIQDSQILISSEKSQILKQDRQVGALLENLSARDTIITKNLSESSHGHIYCALNFITVIETASFFSNKKTS